MNTLLTFPSTTAIRVLLSTLLSTTLLFSTASAANPAPSSTHTQKSSAASAETQAASANTQQSIKGTITAATATSVTISSKKTQTLHTFKIAPDTTIFKGCKCPGKHTDLTIGQHVRIKLAPHQQTKALSIHIKKPRMAAGASSPGCDCSSGSHKQEKSKEEQHAPPKSKAGKE